MWRVEGDKKIILAMALAAVGTLIYIALSIPQIYLAGWAIIATILNPILFFTGFWMGKTEVKGFLAGMDKKLDERFVQPGYRDGPLGTEIRHRMPDRGNEIES